ncbi:HpcH/HpaI aldolase/citrate lyase family protein [Parerythrobacter jejuensis]|uniref:CoA ester lyase n=1 Tax=Parerythrobacter jejuensis TaxID=795812 RepID=A0A845ART8_9SPHN|nr:CoA ester lyase [Parerythrobacter jejuensis]MXP31903.1 CoA ester lyase [Parerythrobacter jejuensis]
MTTEPTTARSWLFAPGDSQKKMDKAAASEADIAIFDLEDAVAPEAKPEARKLVHDRLASASDEERARLWVRVNPLDGGLTPHDLAAIMPAKPGGLLLPKSRGREDVHTLDNFLTALEAANGIELGSTRVLVLATETAGAMFQCGDYADAPRVSGLTWGAEDLSDALGASDNRGPDGTYDHPYELARSLCLLGACHAGVQPVETIHADFRNLDGLETRARDVKRQGYTGMLAIHPAQVEVINRVFTPSEEELAAAQQIVDIFAANPGAGTIGHEGKMLDRPHLDRAKGLLRAAGRI